MRITAICIPLFLFVTACFSQPKVGKEHFYLFLLAGQSNMAGRGAVEAQDTVTNPRIWMLNKTGTWQLARDPLHFDKPDVAGVGPGFAFAKKMAEQDTSMVIGLIPCAVGGSPIESWTPAAYYEPTKSYPYDDAIRRTKLAMQSGVLKGVLWHQGESDSDSAHVGAYSKNLLALVQRFRTDLAQQSLPFVAGTLADFFVNEHPYAKLINAAIEKLPATLQGTAVAESSDLTAKADHIHFNTASARELGKRYAEVFQTLTRQMKQHTLQK